MLRYKRERSSDRFGVSKYTMARMKLTVHDLFEGFRGIADTFFDVQSNYTVLDRVGG